jgi:hypothetical protein
VQLVLQPPEGETTFPRSTGHPQGIAVDADGSIYYADLALEVRPGNIGPGPNGTVRRIRFVDGAPQPPEMIRDGLAFPDAVAIVPGRLNLCYGDCNDDGKVGIDELVLGTDITLGRAPIEQCGLLDGDFDGTSSIGDLTAAVHASLNGCPVLTEGGEE